MNNLLISLKGEYIGDATTKIRKRYPDINIKTVDFGKSPKDVKPNTILLHKDRKDVEVMKAEYHE
jgi:hypothetical protein